MGEIQCGKKEIMHLKKRHLVQYNLVMLLLFVLFGYFVVSGKTSLLIGGFCVLSWIIVAIMLYTLKTGKTIGTKTSRLIQKFDRKRLGQKRWKRRKMIEALSASVLSVFITVFVFVNDFNSVRLDLPIAAFPFKFCFPIRHSFNIHQYFLEPPRIAGGFRFHKKALEHTAPTHSS